MAETIQEKTQRICNSLEMPLNGATIPTKTGMQRLVAIAQAEALEEAVKLHEFFDGFDGTIDSQDLLNMARDLRESVK